MQLEMRNLMKSFGRQRVIDDISYVMKRGVYGLLGVNGVGKTTLIRILCTLIRPSSGVVTLDGEDIVTLGEEYRKILGYLPQEFGFYPELSIYDYMMYISSIKGIMPRQAKERTENLLRQVSLFDEKNKKMGTLSGGMQRRVGIAQAMLNDPKILILDEPTSGLDPNERIKFRDLISELALNRLVLLSTHIVSDVAFIANNILFMKNGKFILTGTCDEIISSMDKSVWSCVIDKEDEERYQKKFIVANKKHMSTGIEMRIISELEPCKNSLKQTATLEDAFLCHFNDEGEVHD